jgi:hypothetical protein
MSSFSHLVPHPGHRISIIAIGVLLVVVIVTISVRALGLT